MYGYNIGYCIAILVLLTCIAHGEPIVKEEFPTRTKSFDVKLKIDEDAKTHEYNENEAHEIVRRHTTKDYPPRFIHQPQTVTVQVNKPQTFECAIESEPEAQVKWFKDDKLLEESNGGSQQTGTELMFLQVNEEDTGEYHCQASNYLGSITSDRFKLHVQSTILDGEIKFEPKQIEIGQEQVALFKCLIPRVEQAEVSWRRNGRPLSVRWLDETDTESEFLLHKQDNLYEKLMLLFNNNNKQGSRYLARQISPVEYALVILPSNGNINNNATFTCLYRTPFIGETEDNSNLARESRAVRLKIIANGNSNSNNNNNNNNNDQVKLDVNLATPIQNLVNSKSPEEIERLKTTQLEEPTTTTTKNAFDIEKKMNKLVSDFYELAKPTIVFVSLILLIGLSIGQLVLSLWRRRRRNEFKKHRHFNSSSSNSGTGSGTSSVIGSPLDCDPVLKSLMARTISAPMASSSSLVNGASKKYRSYRDHMRKVAAANDQLGSDLVDGLMNYEQHHHNNQQNQQQQQHSISHLGPIEQLDPHKLPNLYTLSLAAREQAHSLLKVAEHMRSMSNLSQSAHSNNNNNNQNNNNKSIFASKQNDRFGRHLEAASHLNLNLNIGQNNQESNNASQLLNWPPINLASRCSLRNGNKQQTRLNNLDTSQLVTGQNSLSSSGNQSSSSHSPSSASSSLNSGRDNKQQKMQQTFFRGSSISSYQSNHYSTIEHNEDDEVRYEELDEQSLGPQIERRKVTNRDADFNKRHQASGNLLAFVDHTTHNVNSDISNINNDKKFGDKIGRSYLRSSATRTNDSHNDQLSPYAVSSICNSVSPQQPPMTSEALRALNEQFDVNQLMLLDDNHSGTLLPFEAPPPPPPPPAPSNVNQD